MTEKEYRTIEQVMYALTDWFGDDARADIFIKPLRLILETAIMRGEYKFEK